MAASFVGGRVMEVYWLGKPRQGVAKRDATGIPHPLAPNAHETHSFPSLDKSAGLLTHVSCGTLSAFGRPFTNRPGCSA